MNSYPFRTSKRNIWLRNFEILFIFYHSKENHNIKKVNHDKNVRYFKIIGKIFLTPTFVVGSYCVFYKIGTSVHISRKL